MLVHSNEIIFAGRIAMIDRFLEMTPVEFVNMYREALDQYMDSGVLAGILEGKEEYRTEAALVERAENLSLQESDRTALKSGHSRSLCSVFSRLSMDEREFSPSKKYHYAPLTPQNAFSKEEEGGSLEELQSGFLREIELLAEHLPAGFYDFLTCFDRICLKYMWCISSTDYENEDVSLFDHHKMTSAILSCLCACDDPNDSEYCLVVGDFSGIQNYIFGISSVNSSNVAKRLRARSFYVDVIIRVLALYLTDLFHVGRSNILMQTGGKFYVMVPGTKETEQMIAAFHEEVDRFLYRKFNGSVSVNIAMLRTDDSGIANYSDTVVELNNRLDARKAKPYAGILIKPREERDAGVWNEEAFTVFDRLDGKHICRGCGNSLIDKSEELCSECKLQIEIGAKIPHSKYIVYEKTGKNGGINIIGDYHIRLSDKTDFEDAYYVEAFRDSYILEDMAGVPCGVKYMVNHMPLDKYHAILSFSEIAEQGQGMNKLGVLKADVDSLGFLFSEGLRTRERHYGTISRINTMSRMMETFFCGYINMLLSDNPEYKYVYSVFSGGDDLFLIGPWDVMVTLAQRIRRDFLEYTKNDCMTISASVSIFDSKEHIAYMAEYSEEKLEKAKNEVVSEVYKDRGVRNSICFMDNVLAWEDFEEQMNISKKLCELLSQKRINVSMLRRISKYCNMYRRFLVDRNIWELMFEPLFHYDVERNYGMGSSIKPGRTETEKWFCEYIEEMQNNVADYNKVKKNLFFAKVAITNTLYMTRRNR